MKTAHAENDYQKNLRPSPTDSAEGTLRKINSAITPGSGSRVITSSEGEVQGRFKLIVAYEDTVIASVASPTFPEGELDGFELPAGMDIPGRFTSIEITSGRVIAFV